MTESGARTMKIPVETKVEEAIKGPQPAGSSGMTSHVSQRAIPNS
jgi:hypothetical protein